MPKKIVEKKIFSLDDLKPKKNYRIKVKSFNKDKKLIGESPWVIFKTTGKGQAPPNIENLTVDWRGNTLVVTWDSPWRDSVKDFDKFRLKVESSNHPGVFRNFFQTDNKFEFTSELNRKLFGEIEKTIKVTVYSVDRTGNESSGVSITVSTPTLNPITNLQGKWDGRYLTASWDYADPPINFKVFDVKISNVGDTIIYPFNTIDTQFSINRNDLLAIFNGIIPNSLKITVIVRNQLLDSSAATTITIQETALSAPTNATLTAAPLGYKVSWDALDDLAYQTTRIYESSTENGTYSAVYTSSTSPVFVPSTNYTPRFVKISHVNYNDTDSILVATSPKSVTPINPNEVDITPPGQVTNASATFSGTTYQLTFNKPSDSDIRDFVITLTGSSPQGSSTRVHVLPAVQTTLQSFQMSIDENKDFFGSAKNTIVASIISRDLSSNVSAAVSNISATFADSPSAPTNVNFIAGTFSYTAKWDEPTYGLYSYSNIYESSTQNGTYTLVTTGKTPVIVSTNNSNSRWVRVSHVSIFGVESTQSTAIQVTPINPIVIDTDPPSNATNLTLTTASDTSDPTRTRSSITATWTASISTDLAGYYLRIRQGAGTWAIYTTDKSATSYIFNNLIPNTSYTVEIAAFDKVANISSYGLTQTITTAKDTTGPGAPTSLSLAALPKQIIATWSALSDIDLDKYQVQIDTANTFNTANLKTQETYSTTISFSSLSTGTTYYVRVRGIDKAGNNGSYSSIVSAVPPAFTSDGAAPSSSPTPNVSSGINAIAVRWSTVSNNDPVVYEVHVSTTSTFTPSASTKVGETESTFMMVSTDGTGAKLLYSTNYYFKIIAKDYDGSASASSSSAAVQVSTVGTNDIASNAITSAKIGTDAVGATQIIDGAISAVKIASGAVTTAKIAVGAVTSNELGADSVTTAKIASSAITTAKIAADAVTSTQIADNSITSTEIAANAITTGKIAANAITSNEIAANAITATQISAGAVTAGKIDANAVTATNIAAGAVVAGKIAADAVTANEIAAGSITSSELSANSVIAGKIAADAVTSSTIAAGAITSAKIDAGAVTAGKIDANAVTATTIAAGAVTAGKIASDSITSNEIAANAITASELNANAVTADKIAAGSITAVKFNASMGNFTSSMSVGAVSGKQISIVGPAATDPGKIFSANSGALGIFQDANTGFYLDGDGRFSLKDKLSWNGTSLVVQGEIRATSGYFSGALSVNGSGGAMKIGPDAGGTGNNGLYIDANNYWYSTGNFKVGASSSAYLSWNGSLLDIKGQINAISGSFTGNVKLDGGSLYAGNIVNTTTASLTSNVATIVTEIAHPFSVGNIVTVNGSVATYNGTYTITAVTTNSISYARTNANLASASFIGTVSSAQRLIVNSSGISGFDADGLNRFNLTTAGVLTASSGVVGGWNLSSNLLSSSQMELFPRSTSSVNISSTSWATNVATYTTSAAHNLLVGDYITISGVANSAYNGLFKVASVPSATTFTVSLAGSGITASSGGTVSANPLIRIGTTNPLYLGQNVGGSNKHGLYIDANDYIYGDGTFSLANGNISWNGSTLSVTGSGSFSGSITASSGSITGPMQIGTNGYILIGANASSGTPRIIINQSSIAGYTSTDQTFLLSTSGSSISGWSINSSSIEKIAGTAPNTYTIKLDSSNATISAGSSTNTAGIQATTASGVAFWAGTQTPSTSSPYYVTNSGTLSARDMFANGVALSGGGRSQTIRTSSSTTLPINYSILSSDGKDIIMKPSGVGADPAKIRWVDATSPTPSQRGTIGWEPSSSTFPNYFVIRAAGVNGDNDGLMLLDAGNSGTINLRANSVRINGTEIETPTSAINRYKNGMVATPSVANQITYSANAAGVDNSSPQPGDIHIQF